MTRWRVWSAVAAASALFTYGLWAPQPASAGTVTASFGCTGGNQTWTVPEDATSATMTVDGAGSFPNNFNSAGLGGRAQSTIAVTPGDAYTIVVGCRSNGATGGFGYGRGGNAGAGSIAGRGGGGGSGVLLGTDVQLVGGGGGGSAPAGGSSNPVGGAGGGETGSAGLSSASAGGGGGGSQSAPGAGGSAGFAGQNGAPGSGHDGGAGASAGGGSNVSAGGGGGGWFGGGGGATSFGNAAAGGGGSGFAAAGLTATLTSGVRSGNGQVTITYDVPNTAPVATNDTYTTAEDTTLAVAVPGVLANDSDVDGDALIAKFASGPAHGILTRADHDGSFTYVPNANFSGTDTFTYIASDNQENSNVATITVNVTPVNDPPVATNDTYTTAEDTTLAVAAPGVLANDSDVDGGALTVVIVSGPAHGPLAINPDGSFTYFPNPNFSGEDTFTYRVSDGLAESNVATVTINVTGVNDGPVAANDSYSTAEDVPLAVGAPGVLTNDSDADGDTLTAVVVSGPAHGTLATNPDGSFTYFPNPNFSGEDTFTYRVSDGLAESNVATVTITVTGVNDAPVAANDSYSTAEDVPLAVGAPGVLTNDSDVDGDTLTAVVVSGPAHGTLATNPDGSFAYLPATNFFGTDSFTYRASDGLAQSNVATVTITVTGVNDAPAVVVGGGGSCGDNDRSGTIRLTLSDVDNAAGTLTLTATSSNTGLVPVSNIVFSGSGANRTVTATAVSGATGTSTLTIRVSDGTASSTVPITVFAGGNGVDRLTGTAGADLMLGQNGNDVLNGAGGNDVVCGGPGDDNLNGADGSDTVSGGLGNDTLTGGTGPDTFSGGPGTDTATDFNAAQGDVKDNTIP